MDGDLASLKRKRPLKKRQKETREGRGGKEDHKRGQKRLQNVTDEYSVYSRRGLCVKTGQLRVELIILKVV
jgi:hypothetical protein